MIDEDERQLQLQDRSAEQHPAVDQAVRHVCIECACVRACVSARHHHVVELVNYAAPLVGTTYHNHALEVYAKRESCCMYNGSEVM
jgi:hypothetical protein